MKTNNFSVKCNIFLTISM